MLRRIFKRIEQRLKRRKIHVLNDMADTQAGSSYKKDPDINSKDSFNEVNIIRSNRRKRTISARLAGGVLSVYAPRDVSDAELKKVIDKFKKRLHKRKIKRELDKTQDLTSVAERLNKEYFDSRLKIKAIEYTTNQNKIFGCCNYRSRKIRISYRLSEMPYWVRDYVIIHEMAHLIEPNHSKTFWDIVSRYRLTERARGYLMAKGLDSEEGPDDIEQEGL